MSWRRFARLLRTLEPNAAGVNLPNTAFASQPNLSLHADANIGHCCALSKVGSLRTSCSGAGEFWR